MGSFRGHAIPGSFFILFSVWHACDIYRRYFASLREPQKRPFRNRASISSKRIPLEAFTKLAATGIGIFGEAYTGFDGNGHFTHVHNGQHISMFAFFTLNALFDLAYFYRVSALPVQLDYLSAILAFAVEGLLFMWHLHGRSSMDVQVHSFLTYAVAMCIVSAFFEMVAPCDVRPALLRAGFTFLQGTWFFQVGQILYPKFGGPWNQEDHTQMLIVSMMFTWHIAGAVLVVVLLGLLVYLCTTRTKGVNSAVIVQKTDATEYKRLDVDSENVAMNMFSDDDEDDKFA